VEANQGYTLSRDLCTPAHIDGGRLGTTRDKYTFISLRNGKFALKQPTSGTLNRQLNVRVARS
jgi:hypothetical protein